MTTDQKRALAVRIVNELEILNDHPIRFGRGVKVEIAGIVEMDPDEYEAVAAGL